MKRDYSEQYFGEMLLKSNALGYDSHSEIIEQFKTKVGVPDVLLVKKTNLSYIINFLEGNEDLRKDSRYLQILSSLSGTYHSLRYIRKKTGLPEELINLLGERLSSLNLVSRRSDLSLAKSAGTIIPNVDLNSVEFKLDNWRSALRQALMYRTFSSRVLVIMPEDKREVLQENIERFAVNGIGVAVFNTDNSKLVFIKKPRKRNISTKYYSDTLIKLYSYYG